MRKRLFLAAVIAAALVLIAAAADDNAPNFTTWDANGGGADHSQYSSLKQINKNNVKQLQVAWMYESGNNPTFNPVIVDGMMYVRAQNAVVALDAATGKEIWQHQSGRRSGSRHQLLGEQRPIRPPAAVHQRGLPHRHRRDAPARPSVLRR